MANIIPPRYVKDILVKLRARGYSVYLVGGCVRDMLLGVMPNDWDLCTSALPEEVLALFPGAEPTGLKHGTITVNIGSHSCEVTTFRTEGSYTDHRRPDVVSFVTDLNSDLRRRDFTINAMAISAEGLITDPFDGRRDLQDKILRTVGDPRLRFEEDALRMLRAFRFSSRLGFTIEEDTLAAIREKAPLTACLAPERVREELEKVLLTPRPETVSLMTECGLLDRFLLTRPANAAGLSAIATLPKKPLYRWTAFCCFLAAEHAVTSAAGFLSALRFDTATIHSCDEAVSLIAAGLPTDDAGWKRLLKTYGTEIAACAAAVTDAMDDTDAQKQLRAVLRRGECFSMDRLAVDGGDLIALGLKGRAVGEMLEFLLDYVIDYPENNRRELLLTLARGNDE